MDGIGDGLLLREHAHRVANDMAVAAAALRLAERRLGSDPVVAAALDRVDSTARVQRILCERPTGATVDLVVVLDRLCRAMKPTHTDRPHAVEVAGAPLGVSDHDAWLVSMSVHELVGNAIRHGGAKGARVRVEIRDDRRLTTIAVEDAGGVRDWVRPGGQGAAIVDQLAGRLGGEVRRSTSLVGGVVEIVVDSIAATPAVACAGV